MEQAWLDRMSGRERSIRRFVEQSCHNLSRIAGLWAIRLTITTLLFCNWLSFSFLTFFVVLFITCSLSLTLFFVVLVFAFVNIDLVLILGIVVLVHIIVHV